MALSDEIIVAIAIGIPSILVAIISLTIAYLTLSLTRSMIRPGYATNLPTAPWRAERDPWLTTRRAGYETRASPSSTWSRILK